MMLNVFIGIVTCFTAFWFTIYTLQFFLEGKNLLNMILFGVLLVWNTRLWVNAVGLNRSIKALDAKSKVLDARMDELLRSIEDEVHRTKG